MCVNTEAGEAVCFVRGMLLKKGKTKKWSPVKDESLLVLFCFGSAPSDLDQLGFAFCVKQVKVHVFQS